jgi:hypothetical protein
MELHLFRVKETICWYVGQIDIQLGVPQWWRIFGWVKIITGLVCHKVAPLSAEDWPAFAVIQVQPKFIMGAVKSKNRQI